MLGTQVGPYTLVEKLGEGGMGSVWKGQHGLLQRVRAIKILDPRFTQNAQLVTRFMNEAVATSQLQHRNLVDVFHVDRTPWGGYYIELEYLEGRTLSKYLATHGGPIAPHTVISIAGPIANCMARMHEQGIVHRDLKPENIFLCKHPKQEFLVKVLDLGVAQLTGDVATGPTTKVGTVIGTPSYMATEQLRGEHVAPAADIYALGVIVYQMLTGNWLPYQLDHESHAQYFMLPPEDLLARHRNMPPISPRVRVPAIRDPLARVVMRMIDPDPRARPLTISAAALMLAEATITDGASPDGLAVLRDVAEEIIPTDNLSETQRSSPPIEITSATKADSKYRIIEKLGSGGMAEVFSAEALGEAGFSRRVAVKRVLAGFSEQPAFAQMFVTEARLASELNHSNIVSVLDFSRDNEGRLFLVMEYIHGRDLAAVLDVGPLPASLIIYVLVEMLRGLGYAHDFADPLGTARGLVHRDVSPHNVMVSYEGAVKLNDFGLAKSKSASGNARSETPRGKVSYMSPEQANASQIDGRSDLFAVGVMLWEMLTNEALFVGTPSECIAQLMFKKIPRPSTKRSRVPSELDDIAMRLLERDREQRFPNAEAVVEALLQCQDAPRDGRSDLARVMAHRFPDIAVRSRSGASASGGPRALVAQQMTIPGAPSTLGGAASPSIPRTRTRRRWGLVGGIGSAVIAAGVIGAFVVARNMMAPARSTESPAIATREPLPELNVAASLIDAGVPGTIDAAPIDAADAVAPPGTRPAKPPSNRPKPNETTAPTKQDRGELAIYVNPWALIWLDGKPLGQTPLNQKVAAGRHRLRIANEDLGKDESLTVTITADQKFTIQRTW